MEIEKKINGNSRKILILIEDWWIYVACQKIGKTAKCIFYSMELVLQFSLCNEQFFMFFQFGKKKIQPFCTTIEASLLDGNVCYNMNLLSLFCLSLFVCVYSTNSVENG